MNDIGGGVFGLDALLLAILIPLGVI